MIITLAEPKTPAVIVGGALARPVLHNTTNITDTINMTNANNTTSTGRASAPPTIGNIVRGYKSGVTRIIGFSVWQRYFHDHIIRNEKSYQKIYEYIATNPTIWELDCHNPINPKYKDWEDVQIHE